METSYSVINSFVWAIPVLGFIGTVLGLSQAISRTMALYACPVEWRRLQQNGMRADFSWVRSGLAYAELYRSILAETE